MIEDQELIDTFRMAGEMITKAQQTAEQALELAQKIVMSMSDAVMGQRKGTFQELLGQHSADIAPIDQFYSVSPPLDLTLSLLYHLPNNVAINYVILKLA